MGGHDDLLDGLLQSTRRKTARTTSPAPETPPVRSNGNGTQSGGLNPLDLLALPRAQRDVVNWLARRKQAQFAEIQTALKAEDETLRGLLAELKEAGYINEALIDGALYYRVVFQGKVSRGGRSLPNDIWKRVDLDNAEFLKQVMLFRRLDDDALHAIAQRLEARHYHRNDVILWQGGLGEGVYLIKSGVVGVTRLSPTSEGTRNLAYLKQGDLFGEYSLLSEKSTVTSATVTALSEVELLLMKRADFLALLEEHSSAALDLARMLVHRLQAMNERLDNGTEHNTLSLVIGVEPQAGATTLGTALAAALVRATASRTVFTEHLRERHMPDLFDFDAKQEVHAHPAGYDVLANQDSAPLPASVRTTMMHDRLMDTYTHSVVSITGPIDETVLYLLERADQVIFVRPPGEASRRKLNAMLAKAKQAIHPENTGVLTVINNGTPDDTTPQRCDFWIESLEGLPPLPARTLENTPAALAQVAAALADRLGRTHQVGVYIPTTIDVDCTADTTDHVNRTLTFLCDLFGGATSNQAQGAWNSSEVGQVSEQIHIVKTYATKSDIDRHLPDVLAYVEQLKDELRQEAMALEVNQKLMII